MIRAGFVHTGASRIDNTVPDLEACSCGYCSSPSQHFETVSTILADLFTRTESEDMSENRPRIPSRLHPLHPSSSCFTSKSNSTKRRPSRGRATVQRVEQPEAIHRNKIDIIVLSCIHRSVFSMWKLFPICTNQCCVQWCSESVYTHDSTLLDLCTFGHGIWKITKS